MIITYVNLKKKIISCKIDYDNKLKIILESVSNFTGIPIEKIKKGNRNIKLVEARSLFLAYSYYKLKYNKYFSNAMIANYIGMHGSSCNYAREKAKNKYDLKNKFDNFIEYMKYETI